MYEAILEKYGIEEEFSLSAKKEADALPKNVCADALAGRLDLRAQNIFTIDGEDTRDIDDAVSVEKKDGRYILGVHIADVAHYVPPSSALDRAAYLRATSVYFPDCVIPMLPQSLSNGICSLNPKEDRLTLSCFMEIDGAGRVVGHKIKESVIRSAAQLTYTWVNDVLNGSVTPGAGEEKIAADLFVMRELAEILISRRAAHSVDFDIAEPKFVFDKDGKVAEVKKSPRYISHKMIEQFMILCNETVAEHFTAKKTPFIYRVHGKPSVEKMRDFFDFAGLLGYKIGGRPDNVTTAALGKLLEQAHGGDKYNLLSTVCLRSMQKAIYSETNIGHFGLGSDCYCHFTSPIRRYPDLCVHRFIKAEMHGRLKDQRLRRLFTKFAADAAARSSEKERNAERAEREVDDIKTAEYMAEHVGEEFDAVISGVTSFGLFAELSNTAEGLIRADTLPGGRYTYNEKAYTLKNARYTFRLGDKARVKCVKADTALARIDFVLSGAPL